LCRLAETDVRLVSQVGRVLKRERDGRSDIGTTKKVMLPVSLARSEKKEVPNSYTQQHDKEDAV
jgi:hypothetical protein